VSVDYQVLSFRDAAPLTSIDLLSVSGTPTLDIRGSNFSDVAEVLVNSVPAAEFIVLSQRRILAEIPASQLRSDIRSVEVVLAREGTARVTKIGLEAVVPGRTAEGRTRMVQSFLKALLTTPGTDIFTPGYGGGLRKKLVGVSASPAHLKAEAAASVSATQTQVVQAQASDSRLAPSEKLRSATLLSVEYDARTTSLSLKIRLTSLDGATTDAAFQV